MMTLEEPESSSILFWPKDYFTGLSGWDLEIHKLSESQLRTYGAKVSRMRTNFREKANEAMYDV